MFDECSGSGMLWMCESLCMREFRWNVIITYWRDCEFVNIWKTIACEYKLKACLLLSFWLIFFWKGEGVVCMFVYLFVCFILTYFGLSQLIWMLYSFCSRYFTYASYYTNKSITVKNRTKNSIFSVLLTFC